EQRATPQRFATGGQLRSRRNDMDVSGVVDDLVFGNRWRILILIPKESHALGNVKSIQHMLIGHWPPSHRQIDRHQARSRIESINSRVQQSRLKIETRQAVE